MTEQLSIAVQRVIWTGPEDEHLRRLGIDYLIADDLLLKPQLRRTEQIDTGESESVFVDHADLVAEIEDPHAQVYRIEGPMESP